MEVRLSEDLAKGHIGVQEVLHTPDALAGIRGPGWELFRQGANVGPVAVSGELCDARCGLAEVFEFGTGEGIGNADVAFAGEGCAELFRGWQYCHVA